MVYYIPQISIQQGICEVQPIVVDQNIGKFQCCQVFEVFTGQIDPHSVKGIY